MDQKIPSKWVFLNCPWNTFFPCSLCHIFFCTFHNTASRCLTCWWGTLRESTTGIELLGGFTCTLRGSSNLLGTLKAIACSWKWGCWSTWENLNRNISGNFHLWRRVDCSCKRRSRIYEEPCFQWRTDFCRSVSSISYHPYECHIITDITSNTLGSQLERHNGIVDDQLITSFQLLLLINSYIICSPVYLCTCTPGKTNGPFACSAMEEQTGKYGSTDNKCGSTRSCRLVVWDTGSSHFWDPTIKMETARYDVNLPEDNIFGEHYMTICSSSSSCPTDYPWLETEEVNTCGGAMPCADCQPWAPFICQTNAFSREGWNTSS